MQVDILGIRDRHVRFLVEIRRSLCETLLSDTWSSFGPSHGYDVCSGSLDRSRILWPRSLVRSPLLPGFTGMPRKSPSLYKEKQRRQQPLGKAPGGLLAPLPVRLLTLVYE